MTRLIKYSAASLALTGFAIAASGCATYGSTDETAMMKAESKAMTSDAMSTSSDMMSDAAMESMDKKAPMASDTTMVEMTDAPMVGGAAMFPNKTIVENASQASNLTTLVAAVKQAELVETLSGDGPFTVFAPTDTAFSYLPDGVASSLMQDENKKQLVKVLTAHVIPGTITASDLMAALEGQSTYSATTVSGDTLTFYKIGDAIRVADENGTLAKIETADVMQSNGVVHVVNSVLVPK